MSGGNSSTTPHLVTGLLEQVRAGDRGAFDQLLPLVYDELHHIAERQLRRERTGHTLDTTELVHEACLKLLERPPAGVGNRAHFLAIAARAMRQILVDHARRVKAVKRGGEWQRTSITGKDLPGGIDLEALLGLDQALAGLEERQRQIVECRFFGGMEEKEIAEAMGISIRTVQREWLKARAWIYQELYPSPG